MFGCWHLATKARFANTYPSRGTAAMQQNEGSVNFQCEQIWIDLADDFARVCLWSGRWCWWMLFLEQTSSKRRKHEKHKSRILHVNTAILGIYRLLCILRSERFGDAGAASDNGARDASGMPGVRTIIITASFQAFNYALCAACIDTHPQVKSQDVDGWTR